LKRKGIHRGRTWLYDIREREKPKWGGEKRQKKKGFLSEKGGIVETLRTAYSAVKGFF